MPTLLKPVEKKGVLSYEEILKQRQKKKVSKKKANPNNLLISKNKAKKLSLSKTQFANSTSTLSSQNITTNSTSNLQTTTTVIATTISVPATTVATTEIIICKKHRTGTIHNLSFR